MLKFLIVLLCVPLYASHPPHHHGRVILNIDESSSSKLHHDELESKVDHATIHRNMNMHNVATQTSRHSPRVVLYSPLCNTKVKLALITAAVTVISAGLSAAITLNLKSCT